MSREAIPTLSNCCLRPPRHGKIPTLKISLIQIFRAHLWQKSKCRVVRPIMSSLTVIL